MKIKILMPYHQNIYDTIIALNKKNEVTLITPKRIRKIPTEVPHKILKSISLSKIGTILSPFALNKEITKDIDYVIVKHVISPGNFIPYLLCKLKKIKCIINVQKFHKPKSILTKSLLKIFTITIGKKQPIFAVTKEGAKDAKKYFKNVYYIPQCINYSKFNQKKHHEKKSLNLICVSKYMKRKNLSILINALEKLIIKYHKIHFNLTIIGRIPKNSFTEKNVYNDVIKLIGIKKLQKNIKLIQNIPNSEMNTWLNKSDIFIFPASSEPLGYALVEAMACGLPILCSNEVGAKSYIHEGENGYIFKPKNINEIIKSINKLLKDDLPNWEKIKKYGENSRKIIEKENSPKIFLKKFNQIINHKYTELFGYPASGKTTFVANSKKENDEIITTRILNKNKNKIQLILNLPLWFSLKCLFFLIKNKCFSLQFFKILITKQYFYEKFKNKQYLTDHGFIQSLLSNKKLMRKIIKNPNILTEYLRILPKGNYIFLKINKNECIIREEKREKFTKTLNWDYKTIKEHFIINEKILNLIKNNKFKYVTIKKSNDVIKK